MDVQTAVGLHNVSKRFNGIPVLENVTIEMQKGKFITLLGPSGCGKTTLLRLIAGFYEPDAGEIRIEGKKVNDLPPSKRDTPLVFQDYALFPHMTVAENVSYGLRIAKTGRDEIQRKVGEMLRVFNLEGLENRFPKQLSGGQQQRVAFARALVMGSDILLLDEPLSNLDAKLRIDVREELKAIQKRFGITMVYVTHDQEEALAISDTIIVMNKGKVMQTGSPQEIYRRPANRFVADFVGCANFIKGTVVPSSESELAVRTGNALIRVPAGQSGRHPGENVTLLLRPEGITLRPLDGQENPGGEPAENDVWGTVVDSSFLGRVARYRIEALETTFTVDDPDFSIDMNDRKRVLLHLDHKNIYLIPEAAS